MIISSIVKKILGLSDIDDKLERLKEINKSIENTDSMLSVLSEEYVSQKNIYNNRQHLDSEIAKSIETRYNHFNETYNKTLSSTISERDKLIKEKNNILKSNDVKLALDAINDHKNKLRTLKNAVKNGNLSTDVYHDAIKTKQDGKVKYADNLVFNSNGELLIVKRSIWEDRFQGEWVIPGGHVDPGEEFKEAALRELGEEAGIWIRGEDAYNTRLSGTYEDSDCEIQYFTSYINEKNFEILLDDNETCKYRWINLDDIDNYDMVFNMKSNIKKILHLDDKNEFVVKIKKAIEDGILDQDSVESIVKSKDKVSQVMSEFEDGKLTSNGKKVTDRKQALAIAMSEAGLKKAENISLSDQKNKKKEDTKEDFITTLKQLLSSDGVFNEYKNRYKLKTVPFYPNGLDLENCENVYLDKDKAVYAIGGDWQTPKFVVFKLSSDDYNKGKICVDEVLSKDPFLMSRRDLSKVYKELDFIKDTEVEKSISYDDDIEKGRRGVYENNCKNRKLGRVGLTYGIKDLKEEGNDPEYKEKYEKSYNEFRKRLDVLMGKDYGVIMNPVSKTTNSKYLYVLSLNKGEGEGDDFLFRVSDHPSNAGANRQRSKIFAERDIVWDEDPERMIRQAAKVLNVKYDFKKSSRIKDLNKGDKVYTLVDNKYIESRVKDIDHKEEKVVLDDGHVVEYNPRTVVKAGVNDAETQKIIDKEESRIREEIEFKKKVMDNESALENNGGHFGKENRDLLLKEKVRRGFLSGDGRVIGNSEVLKQVAYILAEHNINISDVKKSINSSIIKAYADGLIGDDVIKEVLSKIKMHE